MKPRNLKGHHSGTARHPIGPLALETLLLPFPRPAAWAMQLPGPSGRFQRGCATSKLARRAGIRALFLVLIHLNATEICFLTVTRKSDSAG